jgi:hypothetical protein
LVLPAVAVIAVSAAAIGGGGLFRFEILKATDLLARHPSRKQPVDLEAHVLVQEGEVEVVRDRQLNPAQPGRERVPDELDRASAVSPGERAIVSQLKRLNRSVGSVEDAIGTGEFDNGSLRNDLRTYSGKLHTDLLSYFASNTGKIWDLLQEICHNTQPLDPPFGAPCY